MNVVTEIKMAHRATIERINELFPGRVAIGHLSGWSVKPQFRWTLDTKGTRMFLVTVMPYLVTKKREAEIALLLCERDSKREDFDSLAEQLKACR